VKYIKILRIDIFNLFLINQIKKITKLEITYPFNNEEIINNKNLIDEMINKTPNWKDYLDRISDPISLIGNDLLTKKNYNLNKINKKDIENYIYTIPKTAYLILIKNLDINLKYVDELEKVILKNFNFCIDYAIKTNERFLKVEPLLIQQDINSFNSNKMFFGTTYFGLEYVKKVIKGRWLEYEKKLIDNKQYYLLFAYVNKIKINDLSFEIFFLESKDKKLIFKYYYEIVKKPVSFYLSDPALTFYYSTTMNSSINDKDLSEENKKVFDIIKKYPELCFRYCHFFETPEYELEKHISSSPYWSFKYVTFFYFNDIMELKDFMESTIDSISKYPELIKIIKDFKDFRESEGELDFNEPDDLNPSKFGEKEIIEDKSSGVIF
jgi:hypothetical protein